MALVSVVFPLTPPVPPGPGIRHWFTCTQRSRLQSPADRGGRRITANIISDILPKMTEEYLLAWNDHHATFFSAMSDLVTGIRERAFVCLLEICINNIRG